MDTRATNGNNSYYSRESRQPNRQSSIKRRPRSLNEMGENKKVLSGVEDFKTPQGLVEANGKPESEDKCEVCCTIFSKDETFAEHVVSSHLTIEGLCDICGQDTDHFVDHFVTHQYQAVAAPLDNDKEESREVEGSLVINPFYKYQKANKKILPKRRGKGNILSELPPLPLEEELFTPRVGKEKKSIMKMGETLADMEMVEGDGLVDTTEKMGETLADMLLEDELEMGDTSKVDGMEMGDTSEVDGMVETTKGDGMVETTEGDGLVDTTEGGGMAETTEGDGMVETSEGDSMVETAEGAGVFETTEGDGMVETTEEDGIVEKLFDGKSCILTHDSYKWKPKGKKVCTRKYQKYVCHNCDAVKMAKKTSRPQFGGKVELVWKVMYST